MGSGNGIQGWVYVPSELASHVPGDFFVRINNWEFTPMNRMISRRGLEPIYYNIVSGSLKGLISPTFVAVENEDYFLNKITTETLELFGDSLVVTGPNASSFHIVPFSLTSQGLSKNYEYVAKDQNGVIVPGDERGGYHVYNGKPLFWNGRGTYQKFARVISESEFTDVGNSIVPLEDQTIIGACTFENRLVVITLQGYIMWSQPNWDGVSVWQDSEGNAINYAQLTTDPGEVIEFIQSFRGGLILSTRTSSNVSGRILNIPTLNPSAFEVIDTGVDSFFGRNSVITSTDQLVGISPQGVINVSYDSLARSAKAEFSQSAPIIEYLNEIFQDNTVYAYLDAHLNTKHRKGYFIHDWSINGDRESKILVYDYNSDKWSLFTTELPVQKVFQMYDHLCAAGWKYHNGRLVLGIWAFSDYYNDIDFTVSESGGVYTIDSETDILIEKSFTSGTFNISQTDPNNVPGTSQYPRHISISAPDAGEYKLGFRQYSSNNWTGNINEAKDIEIDNAPVTERFATHTEGGKWDVTRKLHELYSKYSCPIPNASFSYQLQFKSTAETRFSIHYILKDNLRRP